MKKNLLLGILLGIASSTIAQNQNNKFIKVKPSIANQSYPFVKGKVLTCDGNPQVNHQSVNSKKDIRSMNSSARGVIIGETMYDLQSNSSVARMIINCGDGRLSAVWTISNDGGPSYQSRGTGYQHFDGNAWFPLVTARLETIRTGWPSIGILGSGKEFILDHDVAVYGLQQGTNVAKGSRTWTFAASGSSTAISPSAQSTVWGRMAISGSNQTTVHVIANAADTLIVENGVKSPFLYSRSLDAGATWPIKNITLPGYSSSRTERSSADDYSIDAQNSNVAIVQGGLAEDVVIWRSNDDGANFIKMYVDSGKYAPDMAGATLQDTMDTNDGSVTVVLDKNNKAHVAYSLARTLAPTPGAVVNFLPGTMGLVYWNEIAKTKVNVPILTADVDANGDGQYSIADSTTSIKACRYGSGSILSKPSITVDVSGNIFIVFSLPQDADSTADSQSFRDVWVVASQDNGLTWGKVQNLTRTFQVEEAFASVAKLVDKYLHIIYMSDTEPGTALINKDPDGINEIRYLKVSVADILAGAVGIDNLSSRNESFFVSQNYPNPFSRETTISVNLYHASDLHISVSSLIGQQLQLVKAGNANAGKHDFIIDASKWSPGIYLYTVKAGNYSVTKKMIIQ